MGKVLYGYVSNVESPVDYVWSAEDGACEECMALDGKVFNSADEVPDRPHPNCKCHVEVREKPQDDPISQHRSAVRERKSIALAFEKLRGDVKSMQEELNEAAKMLISKYNSFVSTLSFVPVSIRDGFDVFMDKIDELKKELQLFDDEFFEYDTNLDFEPVDALKARLNNAKTKLKKLQQKTDDAIVNVTNKSVADIGAVYFAAFSKTPEAYDLYRFASPNYDNSKYVQKNGKLYNSIDELSDTNLRNDIKDRVKKDSGKDDCKVLRLNASSSMAAKIKASSEFVDFLLSNPELLKPNGFVQQKNIEFFRSSDLYNALHGALIKNARTDTKGNLSLRVEDFWDFNAGRTSVRGRIGEKLQNQGVLENFYIIIDVKIPANELNVYNKN